VRAWPVEINIFDFQVGHFLRSRAGVVKHHEESPIAQRKDAVAWQAPEKGFDFLVLEEQGMRRRGAFDRNRLHLSRDYSLLTCRRSECVTSSAPWKPRAAIV